MFISNHPIISKDAKRRTIAEETLHLPAERLRAWDGSVEVLDTRRRATDQGGARVDGGVGGGAGR